MIEEKNKNGVISLKEVIKRDGSTVTFDKSRIVRAITMAFNQKEKY